jgi:hypothetical protein
MVTGLFVIQYLSKASISGPMQTTVIYVPFLFVDAQSTFYGYPLDVTSGFRAEESPSKSVGVALQSFTILDRDTDLPKNEKRRGLVARLACQTEGEKARSMHSFDPICYLLHHLEWQGKHGDFIFADCCV